LSGYVRSHRNRWEAGARFFGVAPKPPFEIVRSAAPPANIRQLVAPPALGALDASRIAALESRLASLEHAI